MKTIELTKRGESFVSTAEKWQPLYDETNRLKNKTENILKIGVINCVCNEIIV